MQACPWISNSPFKHCEAELCAWVVQPGNTWTNIGYLIVAFLVFRASPPERKSMRWLFITTSIFLFICSSLFHATGTVWGQILDMYTMLAFSMLFLSSALERVYQFTPRQTVFLYLGGMGLSFLYPLFLFSGKPVFGAELILAIGFESYLVRKGKGHLHRKFFFQAIGVFAIALVCLYLDINRIVCDPNNHIFPLHGAWHFLAAWAIFLMYKATVIKELNHEST